MLLSKNILINIIKREQKWEGFLEKYSFILKGIVLAYQLKHRIISLSLKKVIA